MRFLKIPLALCVFSLLMGCSESDNYTDETGKTKFIEASAPVFTPATTTRASNGDVENSIYWDNTDVIAVNSLKSSRTRVNAYVCFQCGASHALLWRLPIFGLRLL